MFNKIPITGLKLTAHSFLVYFSERKNIFLFFYRHNNIFPMKNLISSFERAPKIQVDPVEKTFADMLGVWLEGDTKRTLILPGIE